MSALMSLGAAIVSAVAAVGGGLYTRSQARSAKAALAEARRSATADSRSSWASLDQARVARAAHLRAACVPRNSGGLEAMILGLTCGNASRHASEACL